MQSKATVTKSGAILLGKHVACDAYDETRPIRVVTHAHADHMIGLGKSLKNCEVAIMTPATKDMIDALKGPRCLSRGTVKTLDYGEEFTYEDETLTLHYADHILGTAQALVEDKEQTRILYTSDFRFSHTPLVEADILVMEATYGDPVRVRPFGMMAEGILVSLVEQGLEYHTEVPVTRILAAMAGTKQYGYACSMGVVFGVILVLLWFILVSLTPLKIGDVVFVIGISVFSLGLIGFVIALVNFKNTPVDQPVSSGLYRISRHPQQLAISVAFLGISIAIGSWTAFALMIIGVIGGHNKILAEEEACSEQYGKSYKNYMERTSRYFMFF